MIQNRSARFWILGSVLILGNGLYIGYKLVSLKQPMTMPEIVFSLAVLLAAISTFDLETAKVLMRAIKFWKNGSSEEGK